MNTLRNWRQRLPRGDDLYTALALIAIAVLAVAVVLFITLGIMPAARARSEASAQLAQAENQLLSTLEQQEKDLQQLEADIAAAESRVANASSGLLTEAEAAAVLNNIDQAARNNEVEVISLQSLSNPGQKQELYDVRTFRLEVRGALPQLLAFAASITQSGAKGPTLSNVNIAKSEDLHTLSLDITICTSPYASETEEPTATAQPGEPAPLLTATPTPPAGDDLSQRLQAAWAAQNWPEAISLLDQLVAIDPNDATLNQNLYAAHVNYGYQLLAAGDPAGAAAQFQQALIINPDGQEALIGLQQAGATPIPPPPSEEELVQQVQDAWATANWQQAIAALEQLLALDPTDSTTQNNLYAAHVNYGYQLLSQGRLQEAQEQFQLALNIKPDGREALAGLQSLTGPVPTPTPLSSPPPSPTPTPLPTPGAGPVPTATPQPTAPTIYVVARGDTLTAIAARFGTTEAAIMEANGLTHTALYVGQRLVIPTP